MNTASNETNSTLTLKDLKKILDANPPILYYVITPFVEQGNIYHIKETEFNPRFIVFHPNDMDYVHERVKGLCLTPLQDEPSHIKYNRMIDFLKKQYYHSLIY